MLKDLKVIVNETIDELLEAQRPSAAEITDYIISGHPDSYGEYASATARAGLLYMVKQALRRRFDETSGTQLSLPGLDLPSIIAVHDVAADRVYYVKTLNATWGELLAGREQRAQNVKRAQVKLDIYDASLEVLRPRMENNPHMVTLEAIHIIAYEEGLDIG